MTACNKPEYPVPTLRGSGKGGGGGGVPATPTEQPDTLRSKQYAVVLDLVSEGEVEGLVAGLKGIYLNDTPLVNANGTPNFLDVSVDFRSGTQDQTYIPAMSVTQVEQVVSTEVKYGAPVTRTISDVDVDKVRVTVAVPSLVQQDSQGNLVGTTVQLRIDIQSNGGGFVPVAVQRAWTDLGFWWQDLRTTFATPVTDANGIGGTVHWSNIPGPDTGPGWPVPEQIVPFITYQIQYRQVGGGAWIVYSEKTLSALDYGKTMMFGLKVWHVSFPPQTQRFWDMGQGDGEDFTIIDLAPGQWEVQVVRTAGSGDIHFSAGSYLSMVSTITITGKTTSRYQRSYLIPMVGDPPWDIRVHRLTADSTQSSLSNDTFWDSYTEIIDAKLRYPNSAIVSIKIDAAQFQTIPRRGYDLKGIRVRVPTNYNPVTRVYTGIWDGTFKVAWSDNPAWCLYDLLINTRYGLGSYITGIDKWTLYEIGKYCDGLVPSGFGGLEPRFTCNLYLQTREEAYTVVMNMASIFRGMAFWLMGQVTPTCDKPTEPTQVFTAANVIDGIFTYQGTSLRARHTVALVAWNDPEDMYRQKVEYVEDAEAIRRFGIVQTEIVAVGCTSRGQAHRVGKWLLYTEEHETETVTFRTGLEGAFVYPGAVILTQDSSRSGKRYGGRISQAKGYLDLNRTQNVTVSNHPLLNMGTDDSFSVECIFRTDITGGNQCLVSKRSYAALDTEAGWSIRLDTLNRLAVFFDDGTVAGMGSSFNPSAEIGSVYHAAITFDRNGVVKAYLNGVVSANQLNISGVGNVDNTYNLLIGQVSGPNWGLDGSISQVRIYRKVLTPEEVAQHAAGEFDENDGTLVGYWPCDDWGTSTAVVDEGPNGLNGTLSAIAARKHSVKIDSAVELDLDLTNELSVILPDGSFETQLVVHAVGSLTELVVAAPFTVAPQPESMWVLSCSALEPEQWRVLTVSETEKHQLEVIALKHAYGKYDWVEQNIDTEYPPSTIIKYAPDPPENLTVTETLYWEGPTLRTRMLISWESPEPLFNIQWREQLGNWIEAKGLVQTTFDVDGVIETLTYEIKVEAISSIGWKSNPAETTHLVLGKRAPPSDVENFSVAASYSGHHISFTWTDIPDLDLSYYEIRLGDEWDTAERVFTGLVRDASIAPKPVGTYTFLVKAYDTSGNLSNNAAIAQITFIPPAAPDLFVAIEGPNYRLYWSDAMTDFTVEQYRVRWGTSWAEGEEVATVTGGDYTAPINWGGLRKFWVAALDIAGNWGAAASIDIGVTAPAAPELSVSFDGPNIILEWTTPESQLPIKFFEVRDGASTWAASEMEFQALSNKFIHGVHWAGTQTYWVAAVNSAGTYGATDTLDIIVNVPIEPFVTAEVVDNNVLLKWSDAKATMPIDRYEVRRGSVYETADVIGTIYARFAAIFERTAGTNTYWVVGIDSAGNYGVPGSLSATVTAPPDFVLYDEYSFHPTWTGTKTNMKVENGKLYGGVNITETYQQHFDNNSWASPQAQVDAGYTRWIQPTQNSFSYQHEIDYGTTVPSCKITLDTVWSNKFGSATVTPKIEFKTLSGDPWTVADGVWEKYATNFRYVRVTLTFAGAGSNDLVEIASCTVRLDVKLKSDSGTVTAISTDAGGTTVSFNVAFIDVNSIQVTPMSVTQRTAVVDFTDAPNPTTFKILLFDSAGVRVTGDVSWLARGV